MHNRYYGLKPCRRHVDSQRFVRRGGNKQLTVGHQPFNQSGDSLCIRRDRASSVGASRKFDIFHCYQIEQQGELRSNASWSDH
jgi:hypothetical protein